MRPSFALHWTISEREIISAAAAKREGETEKERERHDGESSSRRMESPHAMNGRGRSIGSGRKKFVSRYTGCGQSFIWIEYHNNVHGAEETVKQDPGRARRNS